MDETFAVLATGPSLCAEQVEAVRGCRVVAVSDAYRLAPWAEALASADSAWWRHHKPDFAGRKFSVGKYEGCERMEGIPGGCNSGVLGIMVARLLGAKRIILLGFDGHGSHFFGAHPEPLKNTPEPRRLMHAKQHLSESLTCRNLGIAVINCTRGTSLTCYPISTLEAAWYGLDNRCKPERRPPDRAPDSVR